MQEKMDEDDFFQGQKKVVKKFDKEIQLNKLIEELKDDKQAEENKKNEGKDKIKKQDRDEQENVKLLDDHESQKPSQKDSQASKPSVAGIKGKKSKKKINEVTKPQELVDTAIGKPYFIVPDTTTKDVSKADIEEQENKVRRWEIFICEIKLENLQKEDLSVFLNFRIGQVGKNKNKFEDVSSEEIFFKSEIVKDVKRSEIRPVKVVFKTEMHLSYLMLKERYFLIEVWEYRRFLLNLFIGKITVSLLNIVSGSMARQDNIKKATGEKRQFARIYYKILFQEVWDYKLTFEAWKGCNIMGEGGKAMTPKLELTLLTDDEPTVKSEVMKTGTNPNFKNLKGFMHYRGTLESLTEQMLLIKIYKNLFIEFRRKLVSLRGIQDTNYLKTQFSLKLKNPPKSNADQLKKKQVKNDNDGNNDEDEDEDDEDMLTDKSIYCVIEGRINLNSTPRYFQQGELNRYVPEQYYLVIIINRLEKVLAPDDRGVINTYLTVSWRDQQKVTQTMKDNSNPTFNEELYFRIPILKPELTLEDIINKKTVEQLMNEAIKEELKNRPDISIYLWLDGADVMSDESLGYCRVYVSEIVKAAKQPKVIITDQNQRRTFETRIQTFKKKFTSGLFNISPISIQFQACFIPDLPDSMDLSEFTSVPPDFYPLEIQETMELFGDYKKKNKAYKQWEGKIRTNFYGYGKIEKNAYALFYNSIFVKDQFDYIHLVCKYLEKFYVRYQSEEGTRELFANPQDIAIKTLHELVHFVRNIPFINDSFSKKEVWISPDFLLKIRKGFPHDHAVLAACLFLGCEIEDNQAEQQKWKDYIPLEHRTFVCLGTLSINKHPHAWVMTFSYTLDRICFWDIQDNKRFELRGRVAKKEIKKLRKFLFPAFTRQKQEKGVFGGLGLTQKVKIGKKQLKIIARELKRTENAEKQRIDEAQKQKAVKKNKDEQDILLKKDRAYAKFQAENIDGADPQLIQLKDITLTRTKIKNDRQTGQLKAEQPPKASALEVQKSKQTTSNKEVFQNPFAPTHKNDKRGVLAQRQDEQEILRKKNPEAKFTQEETFEPDDKIELPYDSLEIIFNQKNVFANLGNQRPEQIFYHLHKKTDWLPFIYYERTKVEDLGDDDDDEDDDDEEDEDDGEEDLDLTETVPWMEKMGAFYGAQILGEPIRKDIIKKILKDIYFEVKGGIVKTRAKAGLGTKWKHQEDGLNKKMLELLNILEYRDTDRTMKIIRRDKIPDVDNINNKLGILKEREEDCKDYQFILKEWEREVKNLIPVNFKFEALPIKFTFTQSEKMRTIIVENMSTFFMVEHKKIIFNLIGRIFNYPNKVNCVRLVLGYTYSQVSEANDAQSEKGSDEEEDQDQVEKQGKQVKQHEQLILQQIDEEEDQDKPLLAPK